MKFNEFLADIKSDMVQYFEAGIIDEVSVYKWVNQALKKFGANVMIFQETVVDIENGKGRLPENFYSLSKALKCEPSVIKCSKEDEPVLLQSFFWTQVQLKQKSWDICTEDCLDYKIEEETYREKVYMNGRPFEKYYNKPTELRLARTFKKSICDDNCFNKYNSPSPYEINIHNNTIYTNFKEGSVYLKFKGLEVDPETGLIEIPDTPKGEVETYLNYFVKRNIFEIVMINGDDTNIASLFKYYLEAERMQLALALTEVKFMTLTPDSLYRLGNRNKLERKKFERIPR